MPSWRTARRRSRRPRAFCRAHGHTRLRVGYGYAFGSGLGGYEFCDACGQLIFKILDRGEDA